MNYIYDIVLNFNKEYFEFFQWKKSDKIINVKKIPVFKVNSDLLRTLKYNIVKVNKTFLDKIYNMTFFYSKMDYKYMCLVSDASETIGLMFDKYGNLIKKSSLIFDEEEEVNEEVCNEEEFDIKLIENKYRNIEFVSRIEKEQRDFLFKFINNLDTEKDCSILKYIYYDYFEKEENDLSKIKLSLIEEINKRQYNNQKIFNMVKVFCKIKN